jgi:hypothetical protein
MHNRFVAAISDRRKYSSVVPYRQRGADIHRALRSGCFLGCFGLSRKVNGSFVAVVSQKIRGFFETEPTQRATGIHIPLPRRVLRLFAQFVCHISGKLRITLKKISSGRALNDPGLSFVVTGFS